MFFRDKLGKCFTLSLSLSLSLVSNSVSAFSDPCPVNWQNPTLAFTTPQEATGFGRYAFTDSPPLNEITTYEVTTTADYHPVYDPPISGSLRYAVNQIGTGSGIIDFDTTGEINLKDQLVVRGTYVLIDGRTAEYDAQVYAPGGITITGHQFALIDCHHVIIRYLRFRSGVNPAGGFHCYRSFLIYGQNSTVTDVIVDHCSIGASQDDNFSIWDKVCRITVQYCIIGGGVYRDAKAGIGSGGIYSKETGAGITFCHNVITNTALRQLAFAGKERIDFYNNVVGNATWSTEIASADYEHGPRMNILYNWYRTGNWHDYSLGNDLFYDPIRATTTTIPCMDQCPYLYIGSNEDISNHDSIYLAGNRFERYAGNQTWDEPYDQSPQWDLTVNVVSGESFITNLDNRAKAESAFWMETSNDLFDDPQADMKVFVYDVVLAEAGCRDSNADIYLDSGADTCDQELLAAVESGDRKFPAANDEGHDLRPGYAQTPEPINGSEVVSHTLDRLKWDIGDETQYFKVFFKQGTLIDQVVYTDISDKIFLQDGHYYALIPTSFLPLQAGQQYCWRIESYNGCFGDPTVGTPRLRYLTFCVECSGGAN